MCLTTDSYGAWLHLFHRIPCCHNVPSTTINKSPYKSYFSCHHQSSNYIRDYMFNIEFLEYFASIYHRFPSTKPKTNRKPRNTSDSGGTLTTYTPSSNPKHPFFIIATKRSDIISTTTTKNKGSNHHHWSWKLHNHLVPDIVVIILLTVSALIMIIVSLIKFGIGYSLILFKQILLTTNQQQVSLSLSTHLTY